MSDILGSIQKPEWWFSTILVAVIANVAANYIYDWLRSRMAGRWSRAFRFGYAILIMGTLICCSLAMPMTPQMRLGLIGACVFGFGTSLLELAGFLKDPLPGKFFFMQVMTAASLCSLIFLEPNFSHAFESKNTSWFASEIFTAIFLSFGISMIIYLIFVRRHVRKRQGLK